MDITHWACTQTLILVPFDSIARHHQRRIASLEVSGDKNRLLSSWHDRGSLGRHQKKRVHGWLVPAGRFVERRKSEHNISVAYETAEEQHCNTTHTYIWPRLGMSPNKAHNNTQEGLKSALPHRSETTTGEDTFYDTVSHHRVCGRRCFGKPSPHAIT